MAANLANGSTGSAVKHVQESLNFVAQSAAVPAQAGGTRLPLLIADGIFGAKTAARVKELQTKVRIKVDGIVGPQTASAIAAAVLGAMTSTRAG